MNSSLFPLRSSLNFPLTLQQRRYHPHQATDTDNPRGFHRKEGSAEGQLSIDKKPCLAHGQLTIQHIRIVRAKPLYRSANLLHAVVEANLFLAVEVNLLLAVETNLLHAVETNLLHAAVEANLLLAVEANLLHAAVEANLLPVAVDAYLFRVAVEANRFQVVPQVICFLHDVVEDRGLHEVANDCLLLCAAAVDKVNVLFHNAHDYSLLLFSAAKIAR